MFKMSKAVLVGATIAALASPSYAALTNVAGVIWDPEASTDFKATSNFNQWFQTTNSGVSLGNVVQLAGGSSIPDQIVGNYLYGVGKFSLFNGVNNIENDPLPETTPSRFCPGCELTYEFGGVKFTSNTGTDSVPEFTLDLSEAYFKVWADPARNFSEGDANDAMDATDGTLFLKGVFDSFELTVGLLTFNSGAAILVGNVNALLSVTGGAAFENFDTNTYSNQRGLSDLTYSASAQFNVPASGSTKFSEVATGEFQGDTVAVPEPATIALLGGALLGLAFTRRRRS